MGVGLVETGRQFGLPAFSDGFGARDRVGAVHSLVGIRTRVYSA
jgi:hypothetical protein